MSDYPNTGLAYPTYDKKFGQLVSKCDKKRFGAQIVLKIAFAHMETLFKDIHKGGLGLKPPLELDILQKLDYLHKEIKCFRILFSC